MKLHNYKSDFDELVTIVAHYKNIPESAIRRDYYIVFALQKLANSDYRDKCVFKGGTSLSKCCPGSIERFSEDIDLTFLGLELSDNVCEKEIKTIENLMVEGFNSQKIPSERSKRSKSIYIWNEDENERIKLEIGSNVIPNPYSKKDIKTYIQEYLESIEDYETINYFELNNISLNVLNVERTFIDKVLAVKRHAICGKLNVKVRHIYDVVRLFGLKEIQDFLLDKDELKRIIQLTKQTDSFYLDKRPGKIEYNPIDSYDFNSWKGCFNKDIETVYENLHNDLLYTNEKQVFSKALETFNAINDIFKEIGE